MKSNNYILVIEDDKELVHNFDSTRCVESMKESQYSLKSIEIFSFSDQKELVSRNNDFQDEEITGKEAMVQSMKLIQVKPFGKLRYLGLLDALFRGLTESLWSVKQEAFLAIRQTQLSEIHISKLALSTIAKQKIIPFISQQILKRSKLVYQQQSPKKRSPQKPSRQKSMTRLLYRFKLKLQKVFKRCQLKQTFQSLKLRTEKKIISLKQIKKVQSKGTFAQFSGQKRKPNALQLKILTKYIKKIVLYQVFNKIKDLNKTIRIQQGLGKVSQYIINLKKESLNRMRSSQTIQKIITSMCKSINLHLIRIQYKLLIQAFYKFKSYQPQNSEVSKGVQKLQLMFNTKFIKFIYSSFLKLKDNIKYDFSTIKSSNVLNFSELMETKVKSRIEVDEESMMDSLTFRKMLHVTAPQQPQLKSFIQISQCVHIGLSKHQRPLPISVFNFKNKNKKIQPVRPDTYADCFPDPSE